MKRIFAFTSRNSKEIRNSMKRSGYIKRKPPKPKVERIPMAIPRPGEVKKEPVVVRVMKDGREVVNLLCKAGRDEYARRVRVMWERQGKQCCLSGVIEWCPGRLALADACYEHQDGRGQGGGHRDDRIERPDPKTGEIRPYNGVAHWVCNSKKASIRIDYNDVP